MAALTALASAWNAAPTTKGTRSTARRFGWARSRRWALELINLMNSSEVLCSPSLHLARRRSIEPPLGPTKTPTTLRSKSATEQNLCLDRECVATAMSLLDQYICSGKGNSAAALKNKQEFQLATITCFYIAVKVTEPAQLGIETVVKLCRGFYKESTFYSIERAILKALDWRVCLASISPMEFVRHYLELLPEQSDVADVIIENALAHSESATADIFFVSYRPSAVAVALMAGAMNDTCALSSFDKDKIWRKLQSRLDFDLASDEVRRVEQHLLAKSTPCNSRRESHAAAQPRHSVAKSGEQPSSPVSVLQMD